MKCHVEEGQYSDDYVVTHLLFFLNDVLLFNILLNFDKVILGNYYR